MGVLMCTPPERPQPAGLLCAGGAGRGVGLGWFICSFFEFCATSKICPSSSLPAVGLRRPGQDWDGQCGQ